MTRFFQILALVPALFIGSATAQVATGTPPFSSLEGGPDAINLANLNVHMPYPVLHKAGRGLQFNFDLTNDSSFWFPAVSGTSKFWNPVTTGGWSGSPMGVGNLYYAFVTDGTFIQYGNFAYYDSAGTAHLFGGTASWFSCAFWNPCGDFPLVGSTTTDGSGYTLNADACFVSGGVCNLVVSETSADGNSIIPQNGIPLNPTAAAGSVIDRNGNEITTDKSGNITDTLGVVALKQAGGNPNPFTLTYTSPAGTAAAVSVTFKSYTVKTNFGCAGISEYGPQTGSLVDKITLPDGTFYQFTYEATPGFAGDVTGRVASMKLPTGATISYAFTGTNHGVECKDGSTSGMTRTTPDGTWTYTRTLGTGAASTTTVVDPKGNTTVIQFQGIFETQRSSYQGAVAAANLLQTINTCYNNAVSPCTATAITPPLLNRTVTTQQGPATAAVFSKKFFTYNTFGLMTEEDDYDWGPTAPGALLRKTIISYATNLGAIHNQPATVTVQNGSGAIISQATMTYDEAGTLTATTGTPQHVTFTGPRGNLTTLATTTSATGTLFRKFTYYDTGMPHTTAAANTANANGTLTTYNYAAGTASCGNSFATSITEALGLTRSVTWNCTGAVETSETDENGAVSTATFTDPFFWRPSKTTDPALVNTLLTYTGANVTETAMPFNGNASTVDVLSTLDSMGRSSLVQVRQSPTSTSFDTTETDYDSVGLTSRSTLPYVGTAGQKNATAPSLTTTFDALGRPTRTSDSGGGFTTYAYTKNDVLQTSGPAPTGENTKRKQMEYDSLGRLTSVCELTAATGSGTCGQSVAQTGYWTRYTYDANGKLTGVTQNAQAATGQQTRSYVYDRMGRMLSETNPESGAKTFVYDTDATCGTSAGDKVKRTDAMGNVTCYKYDVLHRLTGITYPSGPYAASTPAKTFVYDATTFTCPGGNANVKSRLAEAFTGPSTAKITDLAYCYTARGEASEIFETTPHSAGTYQVPMTYWENGLLKTFGPFLTEDQMGFIPDGEGRPFSLFDFTHANTMELHSTTYNAAGQPTQLMTSCAGATCFPVNYTYDANTQRMTQYSAALATGTISGTLTWNPNGSLQKLVVVDPTNASDAQTCNYAADDLSRIASANCGANWSQTFSYDPFGNLTKSGTISWAPGYNTGTNRYTLTGTSYDANGNLLKDTFNTYAYDAEGKVISTIYPSQTWTFVNDAFGHKVEWSVNGAYESSYLQIGKYRLSAIGQTPAYSEIPLPGGSVFSQLSGATGLQLADWLGTIRAFYSYTGGNAGLTGAHAPFGEAYDYPSGYPQSFTGQLNDGNMTNTTHYFPERWYRSSQGRWLTPDPAGMAAVDPSDPQSWNRYAYVRNSPLDRIDPKGTDDWGCDWGCDWGGGDWGDWGGSISVGWGSGGFSFGIGITPTGSCSGESLGLPCGTTLSDPRMQLAAQAIAAAIKGDWKALLGIGTGALSQDLWGKVNANCDWMCESFGGDDKVGLDIWHCPDGKGNDPCARTWQNANTVTNPCTIGAWYAASAVAATEVAGVGAEEATAEMAGEAGWFPEIADAMKTSKLLKYWNKFGKYAAGAVLWAKQHIQSGCNAIQ